MAIEETTEDFITMYERTKHFNDYIEDPATGRIRITKNGLKVYRVPMARVGINIRIRTSNRCRVSLLIRSVKGKGSGPEN